MCRLLAYPLKSLESIKFNETYSLENYSEMYHINVNSDYKSIVQTFLKFIYRLFISMIQGDK